MRSAILFFLKWVGSIDLRQALRDNELAQFVVDMLIERFEEIGDLELLRDLLRWLWENREEVMDFVMVIVSLFTANNVVAYTASQSSFPVDELCAALDAPRESE